MFLNGTPDLPSLASLAGGIASVPDGRPEILRRMTEEAPSTLDYNRFLFELARRYAPELVVELGTDVGRSAGHFAAGCAKSTVITVDIDPACTKKARDLNFPNIVAVTQDSLEPPEGSATIDVLFIDSLHTYERARAEYELYRPLVPPGGIILFDDIHLDAGMERLWASIREEKADLTPLHWSGFGAVKRDPIQETAMDIPLADVVGLARNIPTIIDDRPPWLRALPSAMDEGMAQFGRYYRFFWELTKCWKPAKVLEIGTYKGSSIAHLAAGNPAGTCVTVDVDPESAKAVKAFNQGTIIALTGDSAVVLKNAWAFGPFDVLFIDASHDFANCYGDYHRYRPLVRPGGLIFFDDIHMGRQMETAWEYVVDPKADLPGLHYTGFGVCKVDPAIRPRAPGDVAAEAAAKFG